MCYDAGAAIAAECSEILELKYCNYAITLGCLHEVIFSHPD